MTRVAKAAAFHELHIPGSPVVLCNIWDAGSARAVADAGAAALATGSWSVAAAQGYPDGEVLPLDLLMAVTRRIADTVDLPLSVDFEGGYAPDPATLADNMQGLVKAGAIGVNFEDRVVQGKGLHDITVQAARIGGLRRGAEASGIAAFINARTDLFLQERDASAHAGLVAEALERAAAYAGAGADGFFVPGLTDPGLIGRIAAEAPLPVNVLYRGIRESHAELAALGVARISYGPVPYVDAMAALTERCQAMPRTG